MHILEEIGVKGAAPARIETICTAGGSLTDDGRLLMPEAMVREVQQTAGRGFRLCGLNPAHDIDPSASRTHFGTSGAAVHIIDSETRQIRDTTLRDLFGMTHLAEQLPNIHMFQRTVVARDITDLPERNLNTLYACLKGTSKPTGTSFGSPDVM